MQMNLHQTHHTLADFDSLYEHFTELFKNPKTRGLHIFSELYLTGYPLQDLCLQRTFIERYQQFLEKLENWALHQWHAESETSALVGGLDYEFDPDGLPKNIKNVIFEVRPGKKINAIYTKKLLPNYDIFDEEKYFCPGEHNAIYHFEGKKLGLLICEDMWSSSLHAQDPVQDLFDQCQEEEIELDGVINLSASPYFLNKQQKRLDRAKEISIMFGAPFIYVNRVGGEDEILFDGQSFVVALDKILETSKSFAPHVHTLELPEVKASPTAPKKSTSPKNTWEDLFSPSIVQTKQGPRLKELTDENCEELIAALCFGVQEYAQKSNFKRFSVALSGGIDSALVLALMHLSLEPDQELEAIYMPGLYSASMSYDYSKKMCDTLGIKLRNLPIKFLHSTVRNLYRESFGTNLEGLSDENIQSRLRGNLLYARSNQWGSMVLNTSNKSEIAVGYSTLYGDSVGAISLLGDLYKTEVFKLSQFINQKHGELIPEGIIQRPPSAELRENQEDLQSLPPYERLDTILEGFLSYRLGISELIEMGLPQKEVENIYDLYQKSEYKRKQFCPIIKVKPKSFGHGYRVPLSKRYS